MRAALIHDFEGIEKVKIEEAPKPIPLENEVQIQIECAGVNPVDWKIAEGYLKNRMPYKLPIILGWECSGFVSAIGKQVKNLAVGDKVLAYCRKDLVHDGTFAEYICFTSEHVAKKPEILSFEEAGCLPLAGLTAWQSLHGAARIQANDKVLIHAGSGGVGSYAIQFAKLAKAYVITTCSSSNVEYVKRLGADDVIDYTKKNFVDLILKKHPDGLDVVYDTVGGETLKNSYKVTRKGGRLVSIVEPVDQALSNQLQIKSFYVFVKPDGTELKQIVTLFAENKMLPPHIEQIQLKDVILALRKVREGHTRGKIVLNIK